MSLPDMLFSLEHRSFSRLLDKEFLIAAYKKGMHDFIQIVHVFSY